MIPSVGRVLDRIGAFLPQLGLRLFLAWEFLESGMEKWMSVNWFGAIQERFPFPFDILPVEVSWRLVMGCELAGALALMLGLATRFFSFALLVLCLVAVASVHAGLGYNVCGNGWKLPLIYCVMLIPLLFAGPGWLSLDHWLRWRENSKKPFDR